MIWQTSRFELDLSWPRVMGIVNLTPDSFSDGGQHFAEGDARPALAHAELLLKQGADVLDLGAESTRPGAQPLPLAQELARLLPVLREAARWGVPLSVDTYKPEVMQAVLDLGADTINGRIDRLVITDTDILIVDYKTDRPAPATVAGVGEAYVAQMAAYRAVLSQRWPNRPIRCLLVWTDGPLLMEIPPADLDRALQRVST